MLKSFKIAALALALPMLAQAQIQNFAGKGKIDWGSKTITAVGIGAPNPNMPAVTARPMAMRAARSDALRNALEIIKGIQLNSTTTVENFMVSSDVIKTQVSGFIQTFQESDPKYMSDKTIEITVTIPFTEQLNASLMPKEVRNNPKSHKQTNSGQSFTGLIIDARGLKVLPAIAPKIVDENGKEIYGSAYVKREFAKKWGMAGYAKTPNQAAKMKDRIGSSPGIIKAVQVSGAAKTDLVISNSDALDVKAAASNQKFLSDCRVIIVVD